MVSRTFPHAEAAFPSCPKVPRKTGTRRVSSAENKRNFAAIRAESLLFNRPRKGRPRRVHAALRKDFQEFSEMHPTFLRLPLYW